MGHSIIEEHNGSNTVRIDFNLFLKGRRTTVSLELNVRSGVVYLEINGKPKMNWHAKSFAEAFDIPYNFTHEDHKFTLRMKVDEDGDQTEEVELEIDALVFDKHPYVDKNFGKYL